MSRTLISLERIKKISRNCLKVHSVQGEILFKRFTEKQLKVYSSKKNVCACPAGICLDFYTDSEFLELGYRVKYKAKDWMYFDIYMDDIFVQSVGQNPINTLDGKIFYSFPGEKGKMKRVTVYLPCLTELIVKEIGLSEQAQIREVKTYEKSILCLGDSITQGLNALRPSSTYPVQLSRHFGMNLLNQGVGGEVFDKRSLDESMKYNPDMITVAYGTNDWCDCKTMDEFSGNVREYLEKLTEIYPKARTFVILPIWRGNIEQKKAMGSFYDMKDALEKICGQFPSLCVIDGLSLVPHLEAYFEDSNTLHPNDEGFLHYSMRLANIISKYDKF